MQILECLGVPQGVSDICVLWGGGGEVSGCLGSMGLVEGIHGNLKVGWVGATLSCQLDRIRICGC